MRRSFFIIGSFAAIGLMLAALVADRVWPPDISRAERRSTVILDASGEMLRAYLADDDIWRLPTTAAEVDQRYLRLLIAYEDQRFRDHPGVDALAVGRAVWQLFSNLRVVSGASTLTMQTARLLAPGPRGLGAKLDQMARALQLETRYSKDEILDLYLMLAPFGGNIEGVRAASLIYFGKEPRQLTLAEAALLVALPQSPERLRPDRHPEAARIGRDRVLQVLFERGAISADEAREAMEDPVPDGRFPMPFLAPHFADRMERQVASGGTVKTTIDRTLQLAVEQLVAAERAYMTDGANFATVIVENATGRVLAYVGGGDYWGAFGQIDLVTSSRSPGSALKPFIYGIAFDDLLIHPATLIDDKPIVFGTYAPRNFDRGFQGTISIKVALQESLNVPAVMLLDRITPMRLAATLRSAGGTLTFPRRWTAPSLPMALGGVGITLSDLTMLYGGIPNGGMARPLVMREDAPATETHRLFGAAAAWYLTDILRGSPLPPGFAMGQGLDRKRAIAFKTGTSYGFRDAWSLGFSDRYTIGVWAGRADGSTRVGRAGRNEAAPLLLKLFDLLPPEEPRNATPPQDVIVAAHADALPPALRRFSPASLPALTTRRGPPPPQIAFPPDGSTVELVDDAEDGEAIALRAEGGRTPLRWIVNGEALPDAGRYETTYWTPDGEGWTRITVIDAEGRSATSVVRLKRRG